MLYNFKEWLDSPTPDGSCKINHTPGCNHTLTVLKHICIHLLV